ncbi:MAG TPA: (Fe-S)-binding protein, partial [Anaerolineae bacterium]|nr:(Fe-S)-binding protein [Anaerolineae bacterium]
MPARENFWNIPVWSRVVFYLLMVASVAYMAWGIYRRWRLWRTGQPTPAFDRLGERLGRLLVYALGQLKLLRDRYGGLMHVLMFYAFLILFIGTVLATIDADFVKILVGNFYLLYELALDLFGL